MSRFRHIIAVLLLLAYTGQSLFAVGAPCGMDFGPAQEMAVMDHSSHHDMTSQAAVGDTCCEGGFCSQSHCQSFTAMPQSDTAYRVRCPGPWRNVFLLSFPRLTVERLFRPPIFR